MRKWCINSAAKYCAIHWVGHNAIYGTLSELPIRQGAFRAIVRAMHTEPFPIEYYDAKSTLKLRHNVRSFPFGEVYRATTRGSGENELTKPILFIQFAASEQFAHIFYTFLSIKPSILGLFSINFPYHKHRFSSFCLSAGLFRYFSKRSLKKFSKGFFESISFWKGDLFEKILF